MYKRKAHLKNSVILLRRTGYSYELIKQKTGVSKSTLSKWLTNLPFKPNKEVLERMKRGQIKSQKILKQTRIARIKKARLIAKKELGEVSKRDLMLLGIGLYIGEGAKYDRGFIQFSNSDPLVIALAMRWFRKVLGVNLEHFRGIIHVYPDSEPFLALKFWSNITGIPESQFGKIYIDIRKNKSSKNRRKLPYGTVHIRIRALGEKKFGVDLYQKILGWIELLEKDSFAGIV